MRWLLIGNAIGSVVTFSTLSSAPLYTLVAVILAVLAVISALRGRYIGHSRGDRYRG